MTIFMAVWINLGVAQVVSINGHVWDKTSGEVVKGALVTKLRSSMSTFTNSTGYYSLPVGSGNHNITITADGFKTVRLDVGVYREINQDVYMVPLAENELDTLGAYYHSRFDYRSSHTSGRNRQLKHYNAVGSNNDLAKYLQNMPGVQMGVDGMAGLYVRGGNADQNLSLMDGIPVYGLGRTFGFLSNFNTDLVRDFEFYRGVAPARYGGRSGSVLDVSYKDGSNKNFTGNFEFNPLCFNLTMDGYLDAKRKTTMSLGVRRSWLDLMLSRQTGPSTLTGNFHDLNLKITHRINDKQSISAWVYNGRDKYGLTETSAGRDTLGRYSEQEFKFVYQYQNTLAGINWTKTITPAFQMKLSGGMSRYRFLNSLALKNIVFDTNGMQEANIELNRYNSITDFIAKSDFQKTLRNATILRFGTEHVMHQFKPGVYDITVTNNAGQTSNRQFGSNNNQTAWENVIYSELEFHAYTGATINAGARLWSFAGVNKTFIRMEPRLLISQPVGEKDGLKFSTGSSNQGMHQISSVTGVLPENGWIGSSDKFRPMRNWQTTMGYYTPVALGVEFNADVYYKTFDGVSEQTGAQVDDTEDEFWLKTLEQGTGRSYGFEMMLIKKYGRVSGLASYGYSNSTRQFEFINFGERFPFRWDRNHKLSGQMIYKHSEKMTYNASVVFMTGNPVSAPSSVYLDAFGNKVLQYEKRNNFRLPNYFRIDIGFERTINPMRYDMNSVVQSYGIHIYNVNARANIYSGEVVNGVDPLTLQTDRYFAGRYSFVFFPSAFYRLKF